MATRLMCAESTGRANEKKPRSDELAFNLHTNCACISIAADLTFIKYHIGLRAFANERKLHAKLRAESVREIENARKELQHNAIARFHVLIFSNARP